MIARPDFYRQPRAPFAPQVLRDALDHANSDLQNEVCGAVVEGQFRALANVHEDPSTAFRISKEDTSRLFQDGGLEGFIHSHPGGPWHPSQADMAAQMAMNVPWAIVIPGEDGGELACAWGGPNPPLFSEGGRHIQRAFLHGVSDCYAIIRDWYSETRGIALNDYAREWEWWRDTDVYGDLYLENLAGCGFKVISQDPETFASIAQPGDVYLMKVRSRTPNHGGVYLGEGKVLEHMHGKLSMVQPVSPLIRHISHWLRYVG